MQYGAEPFEQQQFGTTGVERLNEVESVVISILPVRPLSTLIATLLSQCGSLRAMRQSEASESNCSASLPEQLWHKSCTATEAALTTLTLFRPRSTMNDIARSQRTQHTHTWQSHFTVANNHNNHNLLVHNILVQQKIHLHVRWNDCKRGEADKTTWSINTLPKTAEVMQSVASVCLSVCL